MNKNLNPCDANHRLLAGAFKRMSWLFLLIFVVKTSMVAQAPADGLFSGEQASQFDDILVSAPSAATKQYLRMETLWEMDMSKVQDVSGHSDAYHNNFNLMVSGEYVYAYVELYGGEKPICLHRFNRLTGKRLPSVYSIFPENCGKSHVGMMQTDDVGNLVFSYFHCSSSIDPLKLWIDACTISHSQDIITFTNKYNYQLGDDFDKTNIEHFMKNREWLQLKGDISTNTLELTIGGRHTFYKQSESGFQNSRYYPAIMKVSYTSKSSDPEIAIVRFGDNSEGYTFAPEEFVNNTKSPYEYLYSTQINSELYLAQAYGTKESPEKHSPIMLFKNNGKIDDRSSSSYHRPALLDQIDCLDDNTFAPQDVYTFGVFPVNVGGEQLLILPYKFNEADGPVFKVANWKDLTNLKNLKSLWSFPNNNKFSYPTDIYYFARPKVVVVPGDGSETSPQNEDGNLSPTEATIYAYMPGSLLGAYKISLIDDPIASGVVVSSETNGPTVDYSLDGHQLRLSSEIDNVDVRIYSVNGASVYSTETSSPSQNINLDNLSSGIYILTLNGEPHKIVLQ